MIESVEMLEHICNDSVPPMSYKALDKKRLEFNREGADIKALGEQMTEMKTAFEDRGDLEKWVPDLMEKIDDCFVKNYMVDGEPVPSLFFPNSWDNYNHFVTYCDDVDKVLRTHRGRGPKHGREYFAYYSIWQLHGYAFPVPLGTRSVVYALHQIASKIRKGMIEVSISLWNTHVFPPRPLRAPYVLTPCSHTMAILLFALFLRMLDTRIRG